MQENTAKKAAAPKSAKAPRTTARRLAVMEDFIPEGGMKVTHTFDTLVVRVKPLASDILAIYMMLLAEGRRVFPKLFTTGVIDFKKIDFRAKRPELDEHKNRPDALFLGFGGSQFDKNSKENRKKEVCSATLVARTTGHSFCPWFWPILGNILNEDLRGTQTPGQIPLMIKLLNRAIGHSKEGREMTIQYGLIAMDVWAKWLQLRFEDFLNLHKGKSEEKILDLWEDHIDTMPAGITSRQVREYAEELGYDSEAVQWFIETTKTANTHAEQSRLAAREEVMKKALYHPMTVKGVNMYILEMETDNPYIGSVVWNPKDAYAEFVGMLILRNSDGMYTVMTNSRHEMDIRIVVEKLGNNEKGGAKWHTHKNGRAAFCGSDTFSEETPSCLPINTVTRFFQRFMDDMGREQLGVPFKDVK